MESCSLSPLRLVLFIGCVALCTASPWGISGGDPRYLELPVCAVQRARKPCKIIMANPDANEQQVIDNSRTEGPICTCPGAKDCPAVWGEDPDRTLSFYINIGGRQTTVEYKFCETIADDRTCVGDEVVASLGGHSILPTELEMKNCRCPSQRPMHLKQIVTSGHRKRHDFVCSMPVCELNRSEQSPCMRLNTGGSSSRSNWEYTCQCPDELLCRVQPSDLRNLSADQTVSGYCRRL